MSGLVLNLRPWETFLVGGHVLQNGAKRAQIRIRDEGAGVLRLSDALHPDAVRTPLTRIYYAAQLLLLEPHAPDADHALLMQLMTAAQQALPHSSAIAAAVEDAEAKRYFRVLKALKPLLPEEALLLSSERIVDEPNQELKAVGAR